MLHHKPGSTHTKADFLSRPPDLDKGENDNKNTILLPLQHFRTLQINLQGAESVFEAYPTTLQGRLRRIKPDQYDPQVQRGLDKKDPNYSNDGNRLITHKERIYIPPNVQMQTEIIQKHHDSIIAGHPGQFKTQELITCNYWWPGMQRHICSYIDGCERCQRTKTHHELPRNPLHPNRIPTQPWTHVSSDLITCLPESDGYNAILVIVDRFSKMLILIAIRDTLTTPQMAEEFQDHVWKCLGMPKQIISDRGTQYVAQFTKDLHRLTKTTTNISTAFHPQTDRQTERLDQEIEQYLRLFINHRQTDWKQWLSCTEFAYNNKVQVSTGYSSFYINQGKHPRADVTVDREVKSQSAIEFAQTMKDIWEETAASLRLAAEQMKTFYNHHCKYATPYKPGDKVWLEGYNLQMD